MHIFGGSPGGQSKGEGAVPYVTEQDFEHAVLRSDLPVLVEFTADWCAPCKQIAPEVDAFAQEMEGKARVVKVDVDKCPTLAKQLRVQSVPMFVLFAEQRIADAQVGALGRRQLRAMVEPFLPRSAGALKPVELAQLLKQGAVVPIDTRDAAAFGRAHLPGAQNLPIEEIESRLAELFMVQGQPVLYCRSGDKSKAMAEKLSEGGTPTGYLEGGMLGWESEALPIERP